MEREPEGMRGIAEAVLREMNRLRRDMGSGKNRLLVAIDGRCASGKTTLAACLQDMSPCAVVHMDHFFLRPEQRTAQRLREPGGNVDYERFYEEAILPLQNGGVVTYRPYDCASQSMGEPVVIDAQGDVIVEGTYSCHPRLRGFYDLRIFLSIDPQEQLRRIQLRNGDEGAAVFAEKWIPLEERYFAECGVNECCDLVYNL